mgnify:FL=1|tara:strand:+ start:939 stop:1172 length:234 start_codon:yes stop_codon:yes gene_type:complete
MRYLPVIDLWDAAIYAAIDTGALRLQRGQWVKCGKDASHLSRYYGCRRSGGHVQNITAFHGPKAAEKFVTYCNRKTA